MIVFFFHPFSLSLSLSLSLSWLLSLLFPFCFDTAFIRLYVSYTHTYKYNVAMEEGGKMSQLNETNGSNEQ